MKDKIAKGSLVLMFIVIITNMMVFINYGFTFFMISLIGIPILFLDYLAGEKLI